jgi:hypothetical protein
MAVLFLVFRDSIVEQNEDKKHWLDKLAMANEIADALSDYLKELTEAALRLHGSKDKEGQEGEHAVTVNTGCFEVKRADDKWQFDPAASIPKDARTRNDGTAELSGGGLQTLVTAVEAERETVRDKRQLAASQFENAHQKATQYLNLLSSVLKALNEMQSSIVRNIR